MSMISHTTFTSATKVDKVWKFMGLEVEIILASTSQDSAPLWTIRFRYPRIIHGEVMTHRVFNRNARSSRAVPVMTMLAELRSGTLAGMFTPWHWGKNQSGMQASEENETFVECGFETAETDTEITYEPAFVPREEAWSSAAYDACDRAEAFHNAGYHKQVVNRIIEPFSYIDVLITATDWANFLHLRDHADAEPHLRDMARLLKRAMDDATFQHLEPGEWHTPYITDEDIAVSKHCNDPQGWINKISAARNARISYKPFDGDASYEKEVERYNQLVGGGAVHATPLEHIATPDTMHYYATSRGDLVDGVAVMTEVNGGFDWDNKNLHGNLRGWVQFRKTVPNECVYDA